MAKYYSVNNINDANAFAGVFYTLKTKLVEAGWVVKASSDGTTYNSTGDQITSAGTGAGGMNRSLAWFRIQDPAGLREFTFQRGSAGVSNWRVKYSASSKFTGGSPAATVTPSATDEAIILGGGTDASPTFNTGFPTTASSFKFHVVCMSTATNGVYDWYIMTSIYPSYGSRYLICLTPIAPGTYPAEDTDPALLVLTINVGAGLFSTSFGNAFGFWLSYNTASKVFRFTYAWVPCSVYAAAPSSAGIGDNMILDHSAQYPGTTKDPKIPWLVGYKSNAASTDAVFKGITNNLYMNSVNLRAYPTTVDLSTNAYIYHGLFMVPWPESVDPSVL